VNARARIRANLERLAAIAVDIAATHMSPPPSQVQVYAAIVSTAGIAPGLHASAHRAELLRRYMRPHPEHDDGRGERTPDLDTLDRLADALGVDVSEFFRGIERVARG
jgi:hypothetical protein